MASLIRLSSLRTAFDIFLGGQEMTHVSEAAQNYGSKHEALSFNLPVMIFLGEKQYLFSDIHYALRVMLGNTVEDVERVHPNIGLRVSETDQGVVQEHIEPLLVEFLLLTNQVGLASIDYLIIADVILQVLHNLDAEVQVMLSVAINQLANVLALVGALLDDMAVVLEQVVDEELVKVCGRGVMILINLSRQGLAEDQGVHEAT